MKTEKPEEHLLIVDDALDTLELLDRNLSSNGYHVFSASSALEAIKMLEKTKIDLVITDLKMPDVNGLDLIRHVRENFKNTEVMMITGYPTIESAVAAVKIGAEDYLAKPFTDEELFSAVHKALDKLRMKRAAHAPLRDIPWPSHDIIGESAVMRKVFDSIAKAASTSATVLISGESGTGKELVARAIHYKSRLASAPFVPVSCGGIPEGLLESELFGYVKGAFTGASESRAGFFQTADGGSIFFDEISETGFSMQVKLLRVLQDKQVYMIGSRKPQKVNVRIIAATNKNLSELVKKEKFRDDLFYRLNVLAIDIPPLRDRGDDILLLINRFAAKFSQETVRPAPKFSSNALNALKNYDWPGNVRELENVIQRLVVMTDGGMIDVPDLPSLMHFSAPHGTGLDRTLAEVETEYIRNVLASVKSNKTRCAEIIGIDRKTLREKLKQTLAAGLKAK